MTTEPRSPVGRARRSDRGQAALVLVVVVVVVTAAALAGLGLLARTTSDRARAQTAADAAALASVVGGRQAAEDLAERNGAVVVRWARGPGPHEVTVTVRVGDVTATARATDAP